MSSSSRAVATHTWNACAALSSTACAGGAMWAMGPRPARRTAGSASTADVEAAVGAAVRCAGDGAGTGCALGCLSPLDGGVPCFPARPRPPRARRREPGAEAWPPALAPPILAVLALEPAWPCLLASPWLPEAAFPAWPALPALPGLPPLPLAPLPPLLPRLRRLGAAAEATAPPPPPPPPLPPPPPPRLLGFRLSAAPLGDAAAAAANNMAGSIDWPNWAMVAYENRRVNTRSERLTHSPHEPHRVLTGTQCTTKAHTIPPWCFCTHRWC